VAQEMGNLPTFSALVLQIRGSWAVFVRSLYWIGDK
jgi:hypothetical protein